MLEIPTVIALIASVMMIFVFGWFLGRYLNQERAYSLIDEALAFLVVYILISRVLGLIYFSGEIEATTWALSPIMEIDSQISFFDNWPWYFLKFNDGAFLFLDTAAAFITVRLIFSGLQKRIERDVFKTNFVKYSLVIAYIVTICLSVAQLFNSYLLGDFNIALPWVSLFTAAIGGLYVFFIADKQLMINLWLILQQIITVVFLALFRNENTKSLTGVFVFQAVFITLGILRILLNMRMQQSKIGNERRVSQPVSASATREGRVNYGKISDMRKA
jgi:hypothetical protein